VRLETGTSVPSATAVDLFVPMLRQFQPERL
jgi:hypothetical protein